MWGRSVVMLLVLLAFAGLGVEWLFGRHALSPLDARAATPESAMPEAPPLAWADAPSEQPHGRVETHKADHQLEIQRAVAEELPAAEVERAIADLRDDDIARNASRAFHQLMNDRAAEPSLRRALRSQDLQQRQMAALILRVQDAAPDPRLVEVTFEALDPDVGKAMARVIPGSVGRSVLPYLYRHPESCVAQSRALLWKSEARERLLGAFLLACAQDTQHLQTVVQILSSHLQDNNIGGDALLATHGLYRLGEAGRPMIDGLRRHADPQAHGLLSLVLQDLDRPPSTREDFYQRAEFHDASNVYHDPAVEYVVGRVSVMGL